MAQRQDVGSRVGQVVARLKATFSCASGRTDPHNRQQPSRYVLFLQFAVLLSINSSLHLRRNEANCEEENGVCSGGSFKTSDDKMAKAGYKFV